MLRLLLGFLIVLSFGFANEGGKFVQTEYKRPFVVSHGRELPVFVKENRSKYEDTVERLESFSQYGVKFKLCKMALTQLYGYSEKDVYPFVEVVPSAITEVAHWQHMGHALVIPMVFELRR